MSIPSSTPPPPPPLPGEPPQPPGTPPENGADPPPPPVAGAGWPASTPELRHPPRPIEDVLASPSLQVDVSAVLKESFDLLFQNLGVFALASLVYFLILLVSCGLAALVAAPLFAGFSLLALRRMQGLPASLGDAFGGFSRFGPLWLSGLLAGLAVGLGSVLCILPGLYLALAFAMHGPLVLDRELGAVESLEVSLKASNKLLGPILLVMLVAALVNMAGGAIPFGFLVTMPFQYIAYSVLYAHVFGLEGRLP